MSKNEIEAGHAFEEEFWYWINERHQIYLKKTAGLKKPWTEDPILQNYKFTNAFRELDRGTIALRLMCAPEMEKPRPDLGLVAWNIIWYRMFNWYEHAKDIGFMTDYCELADRLRKKDMRGDQVFTNAHMTVGIAGEPKVDTMLKTLEKVFKNRYEIVVLCQESCRLEVVFDFLRDKYLGIGKFISYEMVSDFRWYDGLLMHADDILTWANIGPGCKRGLRRLGMTEDIKSLLHLYDVAEEKLGPHVRMHHPSGAEPLDPHLPPFELREIEHSLCEFDKYQRVATGAGRPRQRYNGA